MYKIKDKVRIIGQPELYEIYATGQNAIKHDDGDIIPEVGYDYALIKISDLTAGEFEPYINVHSSAIKKV